jgi:hypothetical protein
MSVFPFRIRIRKKREMIMTVHNLQTAIDLVKAGNRTEGARLLRFVLRDNDLTPEQRASAWLWLAKTTDVIDEQISYYQSVLQIVPNHPEARHHLQELTKANLPPIPPTIPEVSPPPPPPPPRLPEEREKPIPPTTWTQPVRQVKPSVETSTVRAVGYNDLSTPTTPTDLGRPVEKPTSQIEAGQGAVQGTLHRTVGISNGSNIEGTGFFVSLDGIVATTRHVVGGGNTRVYYEVSGGRREQGVVVRSFPQFDLAFVQTQLKLTQLLPMSDADNIPDNMPLTVITYSKRSTNGHKRATTSTFKREWFPTTFDVLGDAGGNPVFDERGILVGMLTANASRTAPYVFGLHISVILSLLEQYQRERTANPKAPYCGSCGCLSVAGSQGGFYCEHCGAILSHAQTGRQRFVIPEMTKLYGETIEPPCLMCGSTSGKHNGKCLRCGYQHLNHKE